MDNLEFLDGPEGPNEDVRAAEPVIAEPVVETIEPIEPEAPKGPTRGPDGKFVAKEAEPVIAAPTPEAITPAPNAPPEGYVPVGVVKELRDEIRALKVAPQQPVQPMPDIFDDPEGFIEYQNHQRLNDKLDISEEMARTQFGDELVDAARDWALNQFGVNPAFQQQVMNQRNPYGFAVQQFKRHQALDKLGGDNDEIERFLAWKQAQAAIQAQPAATPNLQPTPTASIASAPSAGGVQHQAVGPGVAFDETIR